MLTSTQNMECYTHTHTTVDLAVDWVDNKVYWIGGDGTLGVVDIVSGEETTSLSSSGFHLILVDPIDRYKLYLSYYVLCT